MGVYHHLTCCITVQYSDWYPSIPSFPVLYTASVIAIIFVWVVPTSLSNNTPIHDIEVFGEPIFMKKSLWGTFRYLWSFNSILCSCPICYCSFGDTYTLSGLDTIIPRRSPLESGNTVKTLSIDKYVDFYIQLVTPSIFPHQTPSRIKFRQLREFFLVYCRRLPLHSCHFSDSHNPQFFVIFLMPQNCVAYFTYQSWCRSWDIYIACTIASHDMISNLCVLILFQHYRYAFPAFPYTNFIMAVLAYDDTGILFFFYGSYYIWCHWYLLVPDITVHLSHICY